MIGESEPLKLPSFRSSENLSKQYKAQNSYQIRQSVVCLAEEKWQQKELKEWLNLIHVCVLSSIVLMTDMSTCGVIRYTGFKLPKLYGIAGRHLFYRLLERLMYSGDIMVIEKWSVTAFIYLGANYCFPYPTFYCQVAGKQTTECL